MLFCYNTRRPPRTTRTDTHYPYTQLFRLAAARAAELVSLLDRFIGVVEVQRCRGEALPHHDAEPQEHRDEHAVGPGVALAAPRSALIVGPGGPGAGGQLHLCSSGGTRSEEHTSELQSLMRISYAVFCLTKNTLHTYH